MLTAREGGTRRRDTLEEPAGLGDIDDGGKRASAGI